ncbi:ABC transporter ATP-binding protein [Flavobacterium sp. I3-2]|uniref:ABC transporter ATP-binding protein n=1 Tax=Flavobacterium sp. I3-2 TaxID=2748319 RepID=UPI0015AA33C3|nr:ABC transporter ATP-binding protein [Flavobacterium sp. I3-2]
MLEINQISFSYENDSVVNNVSFSVVKGQIISIIGASGSGKSTLLKLIYGLLDADSGKMFWNKNQILGPKFHLVPGIDYMKYLAQDFDLMPFVSVSENVGRFLSNFYLKEKSERINELLELVEMTDFANTKAKLLSGGQMQRVALARVLALEPEVLLLDEPFSHIDSYQKNRISRHLFEYCKEKGITVLFTSHTPDEALMFSDEIVVMQDGKLIEKDIPNQIYNFPKIEYVARLTGDINLIPACYFGKNDGSILYLRPHQIKIMEEGFEAKVEKCYFKGNGFLLKIKFQDLELFVFSDKEYDEKSRVNVGI